MTYIMFPYRSFRYRSFSRKVSKILQFSESRSHKFSKEIIAVVPWVSRRRFSWWRWPIAKKRARRSVITSVHPENARTSADEPANQLVRSRGINIFPGLFSDDISSDDLGPLAHLIYASSAQPFPLPASIFSTEKFLKILPPSHILSLSLSLFDGVACVLITRKKGFRVPPFQRKTLPPRLHRLSLRRIITKSPINGRYLSVGLPGWAQRAL